MSTLRLGTFRSLGKALRWLRDKRGLKQYQLAEAASITKAMLSAYETGKQRPTLETLEKLLGALGADLGDLYASLELVNERPLPRRLDAERGQGLAAWPGPPSVAAWDVDVARILGRNPLDAEEEQAVSEMVRGYLRWLRYLGTAARAPGSGSSAKT